MPGSSAGVEISRPKCASGLERAWMPDSNDSCILGLSELNVMHDIGIVEEVMTLPGLWHMSVSYPDPIQDHQKPVRIMTCPVHAYY